MLAGDETSLGPALSLRQSRAPIETKVLLESSAASELESILFEMNLAGCAVISRQPGDHHLSQMEEALASACKPAAQVVLSGRAQMIQRLKRALSTQGLGRGRIVAHAYWSPDKTGLD